MSASTSLHLTLVNNNPIATTLVTPDGEALYSILTPSSSSSPCPFPSVPTANVFPIPSTVSPHHDAGQLKSAQPYDHQKRKEALVQFDPRRTPSTTTIKRLERYHASIGHVETSIGVVEYRGEKEGEGTRVKFCGEGNKPLDLEVGAKQNLKTLEHERVDGGENVKDGDDEELETDEEDVVENSWEFTGPDNKHYKWQMVIQSPMLILAEPTTLVPLARYRRAKIGIVSRPRRAFLEILPAGVGIIDFIVVTFVAFMKQRMGIEDGPPGRKGKEGEEEVVVVAELGGVRIPGVKAFKSGS